MFDLELRASLSLGAFAVAACFLRAGAALIVGAAYQSSSVNFKQKSDLSLPSLEITVWWALEAHIVAVVWEPTAV